MEPLSAGIIAGGSIAGGLLGKSDSPSPDYRGAKKGIRWRVRDAKAAGIHPLYALGSPGIGSAVTQIPGQNNMGQAVETASRAVADAVNTQARSTDPLYQAQIRSANAQAESNEAQAALYRSEAARITQGHGVTTGGASGPYQAPYWQEIMPDGRTFTRQNPDTAMDTGEVLGAWADRYVNGTDSDRRYISSKALNFFKRELARANYNNPGRRAGEMVRKWIKDIMRQPAKPHKYGGM